MLKITPHIQNRYCHTEPLGSANPREANRVHESRCPQNPSNKTAAAPATSANPVTVVPTCPKCGYQPRFGSNYDECMRKHRRRGCPGSKSKQVSRSGKQQTQLRVQTVQEDNVQPDVQPDHDHMQPEHVQSNKVQPDHVQSDQMQMDNVQPDHIQPDNAQPDHVQPENVQQDNMRKSGVEVLSYGDLDNTPIVYQPLKNSAKILIPIGYRFKVTRRRSSRQHDGYVLEGEVISKPSWNSKVALKLRLLFPRVTVWHKPLQGSRKGNNGFKRTLRSFLLEHNLIREKTSVNPYCARFMNLYSDTTQQIIKALYRKKRPKRLHTSSGNPTVSAVLSATQQARTEAEGINDVLDSSTDAVGG